MGHVVYEHDSNTSKLCKNYHFKYTIILRSKLNCNLKLVHIFIHSLGSKLQFFCRDIMHEVMLFVFMSFLHCPKQNCPNFGRHRLRFFLPSWTEHVHQIIKQWNFICQIENFNFAMKIYPTGNIKLVLCHTTFPTLHCTYHECVMLLWCRENTFFGKGSIAQPLKERSWDNV